MSDSVWPHRWQHTRLPCPWDSPGKNTGVGCHFLLQCMKVKSESEEDQSCPTLSDPMDCSLPGCSIHGIFQAGVLEWGTIAFSTPISKYIHILIFHFWILLFSYIRKWFLSSYIHPSVTSPKLYYSPTWRVLTDFLTKLQRRFNKKKSLYNKWCWNNRIYVKRKKNTDSNLTFYISVYFKANYRFTCKI